MVKTRIAPSPTGDPHIGTAYTALFNYAVAKKNKGKFVLRIEDTDRARLVPGATEKILDSLTWLGLAWDEGPIHQSDRLSLYQKKAKELVGKGLAYYCSCSSERLEKVRAEQQAKKEVPRYDRKCRQKPPSKEEIEKGNCVIRLKVPESGETSFEDLVRGEITFQNKDIDDSVLLKSDGWPTYHLAVVVDDSDMEISHVIRAEEWLSSTPKHILLYNAFKLKPPIFAHLPLLRNPDKSKISKRKNPVSLIWYKEQGYLPQALLNYLSLMGWSMPDEREKFTLKEFIDNFDFARVDPSGPVFDLQKLDWLNGQWIRSLPEKELADRLKDYTKRDLKQIEIVLPLVRERLKKLSEFEAQTKLFFEEPSVDTKLLLDLGHNEKETKEALGEAAKLYKGLGWGTPRLEGETRKLSEKLGWIASDLFMCLRIAITGSKVSPPLFETLTVLGKEETVKRLKKISSLFSK
ncbi:MAG: glutamate--tRNA ligase [Candidatus Woykebacteria bacterium RBG_13_40_15]|uniref:Glutamate--tRNA ligase n=1 Tax=Candidatus Woykebacteria bacterium RBG_13_40_15 TaxID=1802593 RepID=A0A1G1W5P0_9BACT|nr:MAG: glutamate--tRNA ligase [Candidatus Woykebacteria bacterium RBG_13_40_15]